MTDADLVSELHQTIRKQGRASMAAQAAAEQSLEVLERIEQAVRALPTSAAQPASRGDDAEVVRTLLPLVDALDRVAGEAARLEARPASLLDRTVARGARGELSALAQAVALLRTQLDGIVEGWGGALDRATGVPVDGERHRVVEARPPARGGATGLVLEVMRAGCVVRGRRVREADVVVSGGAR